MTQGTLPLSTTPMSINDKLAAYFAARPGQWVDGRELARLAGHYAWRSRVSDVRRKHGLTIENQQRRVRRADGQTWVISEYRYQP